LLSAINKIFLTVLLSAAPRFLGAKSKDPHDASLTYDDTGHSREERVRLVRLCPNKLSQPMFTILPPLSLWGPFRATPLQPASIAANRIFGRATVAQQVRYNWSQQAERGHGNALALSQDRTANQQPLCFHFQIINPAP
jgi:hypothetical protein